MGFCHQGRIIKRTSDRKGWRTLAIWPSLAPQANDDDDDDIYFKHKTATELKLSDSRCKLYHEVKTLKC